MCDLNTSYSTEIRCCAWVATMLICCSILVWCSCLWLLWTWIMSEGTVFRQVSAWTCPVVSDAEWNSNVLILFKCLVYMGGKHNRWSSLLGNTVVSLMPAHIVRIWGWEWNPGCSRSEATQRTNEAHCNYNWKKKQSLMLNGNTSSKQFSGWRDMHVYLWVTDVVLDASCDVNIKSNSTVNQWSVVVI